MIYFRDMKVPEWGPGVLMQLEHCDLYPRPREARIIVDGKELRRIPLPEIDWQPGPHGTNLKLKASHILATHFHGDLQVSERSLHIDYFKFVSWGPLTGCLGFIVSDESGPIAVGGHWGQPPAGGQRNWPFGLQLGDKLLSIYEPFKVEGDKFRHEGVALWG
jgi:hypothetical protein